jgi:hypothetical protein
MGHPLDLGTTTFGILIDGYEDTEHAPCSLAVDDFGKLTLEANFPYLEPFNMDADGQPLWVNKKPIPKRMVFRHADGEMELFGIAFTGSTTPLGNGKTARITCDIALAVEGQVLDEGDDPKFSALRHTFYNPKAISPIGMHRLEFGTNEDPNSPDRTIQIPATREIWRWSFEGFDHVISEVHRTNHEPGHTEISARLEFESTSLEPKTFQQFYAEQQKFVSLMQILNSKQIPLVDPYVLLPNIDKPIFQRLRSGRVRASLIRESAEREGRSCIAISQLQPQNLVDWYAKHPKYLRAVSALSNLLPRIEIDAEERMINSFIALETIGHISMGFEFGDRGALTAEYVDECLRVCR